MVVYSRQQVPEAVATLAARQSGVITRTQALGLGLGRKVVHRLLAENWWGRLEAGIYLTPAVDPSWATRVWAGVLIGGPDARASGRTAAVLHGLVDDEDLPIEIVVPNGVRLARRDWVWFRQERTGVRSFSTRAQPPRTRIEDTVLDLCTDGSAAACIDWVTKAVERRLTTPESLLAAVRHRARLPNRKLLQELLTDVASGVQSTLEYRYRHDVELAHGLEESRRQRPRPGGAGFMDVFYEKFALVVELDGRVGHVAEGRFRDRRRDNSHTRRGLRSLRFGWHEVSQEPCAIALEVAEVLIGLGWSGYPRRCPRCL